MSLVDGDDDGRGGLPVLVDRRRVIGLIAAAGLGFAADAEAKKDPDLRRKRRDANSRRARRQGRPRDKDKADEKNKRRDRSRGNGRKVVREAKKHKGAKYTLGGDSPRGFDCSGFTWYVYKRATGMDITHGVKEQWKRGRSVGRNDWEPGDIVFFKNTFDRGLSHNGIFIGGHRFIHAENERTGVVISSLKSDYYDKHYAGARRLL